MILGFAHFGKQLKQIKQYLQETASKKQWTKHEKSLKKGLEIESKIMKQQSKKQAILLASQKTFFVAVLDRSGTGPESHIQFLFLLFGFVHDFRDPRKSAIWAVAFLEQFRLIGTGADLEPTWLRFSPRRLQEIIFLNFGWFLGWFWHCFGVDFKRIFNEF